jgi:hypothetical protein
MNQQELKDTLARIRAMENNEQAMVDLMIIFTTQFYDINDALDRIANALEGLERKP